MLIVTAEQMREIENAAIEYDITLPRLMENAGSAAATFIRKIFPVTSLNCVVFCGTGNNGGDGFVVARRLSENGSKVVVVLVDGPPRSEQAAQMFDALKTFEIPILTIEDDRALVESYAKHADLLIDAIFGTGFRENRLPTFPLVACQIMNEAPAAIVSLDIPSGINCNRGNVAFGSVKADFTIVFQILKPLHILPTSMENCGDIQIVEIGIPTELYKNIRSQFSFIDSQRVWEILPKRNNDSHKGDYGNVLAICGSNFYRGAAVLSVSGALHVGAGTCTIASQEIVCTSVINNIPEAIVQPLPGNFVGIDFESSLPILEQQIKKATAVLFGCGCGIESFSRKALEYLVANLEVPLVLDADAITVLAENPDLLTNANCPIILTPHPGEMARLSGTTVAAVQKNRLNTALEFSTKYNVVVVLKGYGTLIAQPDGKLLINETGGNGLAKGGSGDLLAGMITGFLAQGMEPSDACTAAVWLHGSAGDCCAKRLSSRYMLPSDILWDLAEIFREQETSEVKNNDFI